VVKSLCMKTVGETLRNKRKRLNLTITNIQKAIKIHPKYVKAMENDDYSEFTNKTHATGFLKIYAKHLNLNAEELLALWRREHEHKFDDGADQGPKKLKTLERAPFVVTPTVIATGIVIIFLLGFFGYLFYQYKNFNAAPGLEIFNPPDNTIQQTDVVDITGKTDMDSTVLVNGQKIVLNTDGSFAASIKLKEGINNLSIVSINKLDKRSEIIRTVIFRPEEKEEVVVGEVEPLEVEESTEAEDSL